MRKDIPLHYIRNKDSNLSHKNIPTVNNETGNS